MYIGERPKINVLELFTGLLNSALGSGKKLVQIGIVDVEWSLEWVRKVIIDQTNNSINSIEHRLFLASMWLDGERGNRRVLSE